MLQSGIHVASLVRLLRLVRWDVQTMRHTYLNALFKEQPCAKGDKGAVQCFSQGSFLSFCRDPRGAAEGLAAHSLIRNILSSRCAGLKRRGRATGAAALCWRGGTGLRWRCLLLRAGGRQHGRQLGRHVDECGPLCRLGGPAALHEGAVVRRHVAGHVRLLPGEDREQNLRPQRAADPFSAIPLNQPKP